MRIRTMTAYVGTTWRRLAPALAICIAAIACSAIVAAQVPDHTPRKDEPKGFGSPPDKGLPERKGPPEKKSPDGDAHPDDSAEADPAKKAFRRLLSRVPETQEEKDKLLQNLYALLATADDETAAKSIAQAIERVWTISGSDTVNLLLDRAIKAHSAKNDTLSYKLFEHLTALAPDHTEVWSRRAFVYYQNNDMERTVADLRRVIALDPNHFKALDALVTVWREVGYKRGALAVVRQLLVVYPFAPGAKQAADELEREVEGQSL
jgi:tetratricopeptide (TPR) repeat protein